MKDKDFNNLPTWLPKKLQERRITIDELALKGRLSRTVIYMWMKDQVRPTSKTAMKLRDILSKLPVWKIKDNEWVAEIEEVTLEEIYQQYTPRKMGRPVGSGSGVSEVRTRGR